MTHTHPRTHARKHTSWHNNVIIPSNVHITSDTYCKRIHIAANTFVDFYTTNSTPLFFPDVKRIERCRNFCWYSAFLFMHTADVPCSSAQSPMDGATGNKKCVHRRTKRRICCCCCCCRRQHRSTSSSHRLVGGGATLVEWLHNFESNQIKNAWSVRMQWSVRLI